MNRTFIFLLTLWVFSVITHSCMSDPIEYPEEKLYESKTDSGSLVVKITNANNLSVKSNRDTLQLLMFDSENFYLSKQNIPPIKTKDTTFILPVLPMGHYSLVLLSKVVGLENLNYLEQGEETYQNVMDTLQYLLADGFLAVGEKVVINNPVNYTTLNWQNTTSLISQVTFNLNVLKDDQAWKNPTPNTQLYLLTFQNGTLSNQRALSANNIQDWTFQFPIAKGANYTFMVVDFENETEIGKLKNGKTTMDSIQIMLEPKIDKIRMAVAATPKNLTKSTETVTMGNAIQSISIKLTGTTTPSWTTDATGWSLMIFDGSEYLKRIISKEGKMTTTDSWNVKVFKDATYTLLAVGNAQSSVGEFKEQNTARPIKTQYILDNLQETQTDQNSWLGYGSGKLTQLVLTNTYLLTPQKRLKFSALSSLSVKEVKTRTTSNYFANNPVRVTGIVTNNGRTTKSGVANSGLDNPISNLVILQDLNSVADGEAILIEFTNPPEDLNIGDQITLALQDGEFTSSNPKASNMTVLQKVTYTRTGDKAEGIDLPAKTLSLSEFTTVNYTRYEGMLVQVSENVEFKWFKDVQFNTFSADKMILRDASVAATTLPSSRKTINMQIDSKAIPTFAGKLLPSGKGKIAGFLVRTKSEGKFAVHPRGNTDINMTNNIPDRVDRGVIVHWNSSNIITKNGGIYPIQNQDRGVSRETSHFVVQNSNPRVYADLTGGDGSSSARKGIYIAVPPAKPLIDYQIVISLDTRDLANGESVRITNIAGDRGTYANVWPISGGGDLVWDIKYSINDGSIKSLSEKQQLYMKNREGSSGVGGFLLNDKSPFVPVEIPNVGGYANVKIHFEWKSGQGTKSSAFNVTQNNCWSSFTDVKIEQF